jgi:hypothetical protein
MRLAFPLQQGNDASRGAFGYGRQVQTGAPPGDAEYGEHDQRCGGPDHCAASD